MPHLIIQSIHLHKISMKVIIEYPVLSLPKNDSRTKKKNDRKTTIFRFIHIYVYLFSSIYSVERIEYRYVYISTWKRAVSNAILTKFYRSSVEFFDDL